MADSAARGLRRFPSLTWKGRRIAWALTDHGSGKLLAGPFESERETKQAQRRLGMGRVELIEVYRG